MHLFASELLSRYGVFWSQLESEIEALQLCLVTARYSDDVSVSGRS